MRKLILILPILLVIGCSRPRVYIPESYRVKKEPVENGETVEKETAIITTGEANKPKKINATYRESWGAALESVNYLKWPPAFMEEQDGVIRLKEAYVYRKNGKLIRSYTFPSRTDIQRSDINDYLEKVARYTPGTTRTTFTQENLKITLSKISDDTTEIKIDYSIRPYTFDGKIGYEVISNGYIESIILDRMKEDLGTKPVARN
ncbi:MAG: hypothetical protein RIG61_07160 [Deltaproteobacteria bacterium]